MKILAIDTATEACSVALWDDGRVYSRFEICPREHTQRILPYVEQVLAEAGIQLSQLNALAFGQGPGSFTGVRITIGIAQGLALGANLPMIGISSLQMLAQQAYRKSGATHVLAAIDARMGEVYWGEYCRTTQGEWQLQTPEAVMSPNMVVQRLSVLSGVWSCVGSGWEAHPVIAEQTVLPLQQTTCLLPEAIDMLPLALRAWQQGDVVSVEASEPVYLRNEVTWKKLPGR